MNKLITLLALCCAASAGDFQTRTNSAGEVTLTAYTPSTLQSVVIIPQHVDRVGSWAFQNRLEVQTVYLPNKTRYIGTGAFYGCSNMRNVRLSHKTEGIGNLAFSRCVSLQAVLIPSGCSLYGGQTFDGCYSLDTWRPWLAVAKTSGAIFIVYEGKLQSSTNLTDWVDLPEDSGIRQIEMKETVNFFRTRE
jgi:hypothetical protein